MTTLCLKQYAFQSANQSDKHDSARQVFSWRSLRFLITLILLLIFTNAHAEEQIAEQHQLRIAAASDLRDALTAISNQFRQLYPNTTLDIIFGSSGKLSQQIQHGAPFDIYFAADRSYTDALEQQGLNQNAIQVIGLGRLVLVARSGLAEPQALAELSNLTYSRIAIAEPQHAPYGDRAKQALQQLQIWQVIEHKIVYADNVAKALQLVQSGAVDAAIVALALVKKPTNIPVLKQQNQQSHQQTYLEIDENLHQPLQAAMMLIKRPKRQAALTQQALSFFDYVNSEPAQRLLRLYGFSQPTAVLNHD